MSCKVISIDSSTNKSGYAIWLNGEFEKSGLIDLSDIKDSKKRIEKMMISINILLSQENPDIVYVEEVNVTRNAMTSRALIRIQGTVQYWCALHKKWFETVQPSKWRANVNLKASGRKRDDYKKAAIKYVLDNYGKQVNDDEAEAICIGEAMLKIYR